MCDWCCVTSNKTDNSIFVMQVVAIINSCTPNGLGDMTVTLKVYSRVILLIKCRGSGDPY